MTTTEAVNHTLWEQNTLCRLRRASFVANEQHKFFPKDNPTGCDSEGNRPNFCEAQLLSGVTEPTETSCIVKTLASTQACALFTLEYCSIKNSFFLKESHTYSITELLRLVQGKAICIAVMTSYRIGKLLCQMCFCSTKQLASRERLFQRVATFYVLSGLKDKYKLHSLESFWS